jgi:hypothetical protein
MTEVARLRSVLLQVRDALIVCVESLERVISMIDETWPQIGHTGRVGQLGDSW